MKKVYKDLKALIDYLQKEYTNTTTVWKKSDHANINQKRSLVIEIDSNGKIYQAISEYVQLLNEVSAEITLSLSTICQSKVTARVKAQNSIEFKIEFGKI